MDVYSLTLIAKDSAFLDRVKYHMIQKAVDVAANSPTVSDQVLIQKILNDAEPVHIWAIAALTNTTIAAATQTLDGTSITDTDLKNQIYNQWSAFLI